MSWLITTFRLRHAGIPNDGMTAMPSSASTRAICVSSRLTMDPVRTVIEAGAWSSQRHWDSHEDEFVWVLDGELTLITDAGEETLRAGDCAAFRSGDPDGHHLVNKSGRPARVLEIGTNDRQDRCTYTDIDMIADHRGYTHRDGTPYPLKE